MLAGRRIDTQIDFNLVQRWIKMCNAHGPACSKQTFFGRKVSHIRLIDIDRRRLVWRTTLEAYTALSYMWGPPSLPQVRLTRSTQAGLFLDGALAEDNNMIPRTIRDAMLVCERLAIPYLWVDALCIEQDSPDFNAHLRMMNDIYASAYLTLAAAAGEDSWAGLPGVLPNSRKIHQTSIAIDGWDIGLATPHFLSSVIRSPWANRGWTFQERLFSKRMLIFGEHQCFFYCDKAIRIETTITEVDEECHEKSHYFPTANYWVSDRDKLYILSSRLGNGLKEYFSLFSNHRTFSLTYEEGVLRAFGGVIATFEENMSSQFFFGLPLSMFTWALLLDYTQFSRRASFPSWSWAGWSADREDYLYPYKSVVLNRSWTLTVFYRLHPTLNKVHGQGKWILEKIEEVDTRGAAAYRDMDSVLYNQHLPDHLDRKDLEKLLVFDTPASKLEVSALKFKSTRPHTEWAADKGYDMMFASVRVGPGHLYSWTDYLPYIPRELFDGDTIDNSPSIWLDFVLIAKVWRRGASWVYLMIIDTDEKEISTKLSLCVLEQKEWLKSNPQTRRVYLM